MAVQKATLSDCLLFAFPKCHSRNLFTGLMTSDLDAFEQCLPFLVDLLKNVQ